MTITCPHCRGSGKIVDMVALGLSMRERRKKLKVTLIVVAERMGYHHSTISMLERGKLLWKTDTLAAYEAAITAEPSPPQV